MNNNRAQLLHGNCLGQNNFIMSFCNLPEYKWAIKWIFFGANAQVPGLPCLAEDSRRAVEELLLLCCSSLLKGNPKCLAGLEAHTSQKCAVQVGFYNTFISFCQFTASCHWTDSSLYCQWSNALSDRLCYPSTLQKDSWSPDFSQSFKAELKQDFAPVVLLRKLGRMWFCL